MFELSYSALMPPMCLVVGVLIGGLIALRWRRVGLTVVLISALPLYASCTQFVSDRLIAHVESQVPPASAADLASAQAIAVLSGDIYHGRAGGVADDVGLLTLDRLRIAAALYRAHPLPILMTGGITGDAAESSAAVMAHALEQDYGIKTTWIEQQADTTYTNGAYSAKILKANGISRVILVTQAWHLPRAVWSFARAGMTAIPAPAERTYVSTGIDWTELQPDYASFGRTFLALHEMLGLAYYHWRYGSANGAG